MKAGLIQVFGALEKDQKFRSPILSNRERDNLYKFNDTWARKADGEWVSMLPSDTVTAYAPIKFRPIL